jgi:drug/metabolite transporter (DMT)-like permease
MLVTAFGFAVTMILLKLLTSTESPYAVVFWMNLIQLPLALSGSRPDKFLLAAAHGWLPIVGIGISGLSAHYCLTNAFRAGDATVVVPLDFMRIPLIALVGFWAYGEALDGYVFAGAALIVAGVAWNLRAEATARPAVPNE